MAELHKIDLGIDSTGKGGDSQRTAFEKCNDNFESLDNNAVSSFESLSEKIDSTTATFAKKGVNKDITALEGLKKNITQPSDATDNRGSVTLRQLNAAIAMAGSGRTTGTRVLADFIGATQWWNGSRAALPAGFLPTDGQLCNRADYPDLATLIENSIVNTVSDEEWLADPKKRGNYSTGDGSTTFRLPDINGVQEGSIKGLFIRGDGYAPSGSVQSDAIRNITGSINDIYGGVNLFGTGVFQGATTLPFNEALGSVATERKRSTLTTNLFDASQVVPTSDENHPAFISSIHITRVNGLIKVDTHQDVCTSVLNSPSTNDLVFGGTLESSFQVGESKYASATMQSYKTEGQSGTGIKFNTTDYTTNPPTTRQYTLNSDSGEIFTCSSPEDGRNKLGLTNLPSLGTTNVWEKSQILTRPMGKDALALLTEDHFPNPAPPTGTVLRTPSLLLQAKNLGDPATGGIFCRQYCDEIWGVGTRTVIELHDWFGNFDWWTFCAGGNAVANGGAWINSSDERSKTDFQKIDTGDILEQSKTFHGYTFTRINRGEKSAGFKAQDIQKILPDAVHVVGSMKVADEEIPDFLGLDYGAVTAFNHECINALIQKFEALELVVKEQNSKIKEQDSKIKELESKFKKLETPPDDAERLNAAA